MYSYINFIYGIPLTEEIRNLPMTKELWNKLEEDEDEGWEETDTLGDCLDIMEGMCGFATMYDGSAPEAPGYFGVRFGSLEPFGEDFAGCSLQELLSDATPSEETKAEVLELLKDLPEEIKAVARPVGVYLVWSSS